MEEKKEKKVEYLELIYDLIFVYIIGRNNALLHHTEGGFVTSGIFLAYLLCSLAVIQIWNYSTFYINIYGRNGVRDHAFVFVNMYLLYYMADGTSVQWRGSVFKYSAAWALILLNIAVQHFIELKNRKNAPWEMQQLRRKAFIILAEAVLVGVHMLIFALSGVSMPYIPILFGMLMMLWFGRENVTVPVDFAHLSERAMLFVVFTFGEMIISIASYFSGGLSFSTVYFSGMGFLVVVGLFVTYELFYNKILDRERTTNGIYYMFIHVFLIFALNNISVALEFMREEEVELMPKTLFLTGSIILYYLFMALTMHYSKSSWRPNAGLLLTSALTAASFAALMLLTRGMMYLNIAVTVIYVLGVSLAIFLRCKRTEKRK